MDRKELEAIRQIMRENFDRLDRLRKEAYEAMSETNRVVNGIDYALKKMDEAEEAEQAEQTPEPVAG